MRAVPKLERARGSLRAPSSKSYTARALLLGAMSEGETTVEDALDCDDSRYMLDAIRRIGYEVRGDFASGITIGERTGISATEVDIYTGNAGTAMRFLAGFLAFTPGRFILTGDERMCRRPIGDLVDALASIGTEVEYLGEEGCPPLRMRGRIVRGGFEVNVSGAVSSQFVSSLMMAGAKLAGGIRLRVGALTSRPYIDVTREVLAAFGTGVEEIAPGVYRVGGGRLECPLYRVEGDFSSASYWFAAAAATGGEVTVSHLGRESAQGDRRFLEVLEAMGCRVGWSEDSCTVSSAGALSGGSFDCNGMPDAVPTLAAIAPLASSRVEIRNVANLRVKESDRIAALRAELGRLGARAEEREDGLLIEPGWTGAEATVDPHGDHRIAMAFAIAGLARGGVSVAEEQVVAKSYPRFWRDLDALVTSSA